MALGLDFLEEAHSRLPSRVAAYFLSFVFHHTIEHVLLLENAIDPFGTSTSKQ